jgi:hypothetical protein
MMSSIGKLMSEKLDVLRLTFYTAPLTTIVLLPFYYSLEHEKYEQYQATSSNAYIGKYVNTSVQGFVLAKVHSNDGRNAV